MVENKENIETEEKDLENFIKDLEYLQNYLLDFKTSLNTHKDASIAFAKTDLGKLIVPHTYFKFQHPTKINSVYNGIMDSHFKVIDDAIDTIMIEDEKTIPSVNELELSKSGRRKVNTEIENYPLIKDYETVINAYRNIEGLLKVIEGEVTTIYALTKGETTSLSEINTEEEDDKINAYKQATEKLTTFFKKENEIQNKIKDLINYANKKANDYKKMQTYNVGIDYFEDETFAKSFADLYDNLQERGE
ncbi:hypothetical protein GF374_00835 [Candidatus Woesearchaeota archaeon]|nr:hypothetical protein [Candidatus Woesearchaeota archaeon]